MRGGLDRPIQTKGGLRREGFRREVGTDGADPQKGDPTVIKCLGGQDRSGGGPDSHGRARGGP